jgi:hypothetical protein
LRRQFEQSIGQTLTETVEAAAIARGKPRRNEQLLSQLFSTEPAQSEEQQ